MSDPWPDEIPVDGATLEELERVMTTEAIGADNAMPSGAIADRVGIDDSATNPKTRKAIKEGLLKARQIPVVSSNAGYFVAATPGDVASEIQSQEGRIAGIKDRIDALEAAMDAWDFDTTDTAAETDIPPRVQRQIDEDPLLTVEDYLEYQRGGEA